MKPKFCYFCLVGDTVTAGFEQKKNLRFVRNMFQTKNFCLSLLHRGSSNRSATCFRLFVAFSSTSLLVGVKAGRVHLCRVAGNTVIPYGK